MIIYLDSHKATWKSDKSVCEKDIYIYIYIYRERERERKREKDREKER